MSRRLLGLLPLSFFVIHGSRHVAAGHAYELFWACTTASLLIGLGILTDTRRLTASAVLWLPIGNVMWIYDAVHTGLIMWTSLLTHVGTMLIALWSLRSQGFPRGSFVTATLLGMLLQLISHYVTPYQSNVNVSQFIYPGSESLFPSYGHYVAATWVLCCASFYLIEKLCLRILPSPSSALVDVSINQ